MTDWRNQHRKCERCKSEYRPVRQDQSYCSRDCKRKAAYVRERLTEGTRPRRRAIKASDKPLANPLPGSVRNGGFSPMKAVACEEGYPPHIPTG
jgi:hypothetical protein